MLLFTFTRYDNKSRLKKVSKATAPENTVRLWESYQLLADNSAPKSVTVKAHAP